MGDFDFIEKLYSLAKENGCIVESLNVGDRHNNKGDYKYLTLALIIPGKKCKAKNIVHETTEEKNSVEKAQKEKEVNKNEI